VCGRARFRAPDDRCEGRSSIPPGLLGRQAASSCAHADFLEFEDRLQHVGQAKRTNYLWAMSPFQISPAPLKLNTRLKARQKGRESGFHSPFRRPRLR